MTEHARALIDTQDKTPDQIRSSILKLEAALLAMPEHQIHIEPSHHFAPGLYLREILIPKGATITGMIHKTEHLCILSKGDVVVCTGEEVKRIKASAVVHSKPGAKRAIYAHEDSVWINIHHNPLNETDLDKLEEIFIAKSFDEIPGLTELNQIEGSK